MYKRKTALLHRFILICDIYTVRALSLFSLLFSLTLFSYLFTLYSYLFLCRTLGEHLANIWRTFDEHFIQIHHYTFTIDHFLLFFFPYIKHKKDYNNNITVAVLFAHQIPLISYTFTTPICHKTTPFCTILRYFRHSCYFVQTPRNHGISAFFSS